MNRIAKPLLFLSLAVSLTALSSTASAHERGHDNGRGWGHSRHDHFRGHHDDRRYDRDERYGYSSYYGHRRPYVVREVVYAPPPVPRYYGYSRDPAIVIGLPPIVIPLR